MKIYQLILLSSSIFLSACGNDSPSNQQALVPSPTSTLTTYMDKQKVCEIIDTKTIQEVMQIQSPIETRVENYRSFYICNYSWEGKEYGEFSITLSIYDKNRETFPPKKLSQSEMNKKIDEMVADMDKRNKSQNKMAYEYAKKSIIAEEKAANQFELIKGIGDQAILVKKKGESVLTSVVENTKLTILMQNSFNLRSKKPPRSEASKKIAQLILKRN